MINVVQNKIKNHKDIIEYIESKPVKWFHRDLQTKLGKSNFYTLYKDNMDQELLDLIFVNLDKKLKIINKFKLHLFTLTTSDTDGLVCEWENKYYFLPDRAGQYIDFPLFSWHWVNPVKHKRYSLVVGE